jgi:hypothetical protein
MLWWGGSKRTLLLNLKIGKKWFGLSMQWWLDIALNLFFFVSFVTFFIFLSHKQIPLPSLFSFYSFVKAATAIESLGKGSHHIYYEHVRVRPLFGALCYCYTFVTLLVGSWDLTMHRSATIFAFLLFERCKIKKNHCCLFLFLFMYVVDYY